MRDMASPVIGSAESQDADGVSLSQDINDLECTEEDLFRMFAACK
jgi:hypothetical protein